MQPITIRPYDESDSSAVLRLLDLNTPRWFAPEERKELVYYLASEREDYFVLTHMENVIGAAGINYFPDQQLARISWDILHPDYHGKGYGSQLLNYRLNLLRQQQHITQVIVRTSQLVYPFYEKSGFKLHRTVIDYWAVGYDLYELKLWL